jgi:hypothetical protein
MSKIPSAIVIDFSEARRTRYFERLHLAAHDRIGRAPKTVDELFGPPGWYSEAQIVAMGFANLLEFEGERYSEGEWELVRADPLFNVDLAKGTIRLLPEGEVVQ